MQMQPIMHHLLEVAMLFDCLPRGAAKSSIISTGDMG
jgi:hypothetical protein